MKEINLEVKITIEKAISKNGKPYLRAVLKDENKNLTYLAVGEQQCYYIYRTVTGENRREFYNAIDNLEI